MSAFRGRRSGRSDEEEHALDEFSEELSTYTNPDVDSLVFEAGGKSITIKQVLTRICYFALFDDHFADSRRHQSLWRHRLGCRLLFGLLADLALHARCFSFASHSPQQSSWSGMWKSNTAVD
jgi:hypothetical protein